jgi:hypothetical protein
MRRRLPASASQASWQALDSSKQREAPPLPPDLWNERKRLYEHSQLIIDSLSITAATQAKPGGGWTCAVAAAVFLPQKPES